METEAVVGGGFALEDESDDDELSESVLRRFEVGEEVLWLRSSLRTSGKPYEPVGPSAEAVRCSSTAMWGSEPCLGVGRVGDIPELFIVEDQAGQGAHDRESKVVSLVTKAPVTHHTSALVGRLRLKLSLPRSNCFANSTHSHLAVP